MRTSNNAEKSVTPMIDIKSNYLNICWRKSTLLQIYQTTK